MVGAIIKGVLKSKYKPKPKSKYPKTVSRKLKREAKIHPSEKYLSRKAVLGGAKAALMKKKPLISKFEAGVGVGVAGTLGTKEILKRNKAKKDAKAASDKKLKESLKKHEKKTKEKRRKYGKHHG
ncbi:hypothetical protein CMI37_32655 [Candidatus Pacearchaeota archaeon]|nr:hypothetical protein [Candidatus Pacearchaeota archaeon]|tara:strand:- start:283 stop:657 length:375 start_codon:yes stop_codon:yes gene_type:complete